MRYLLYGSLFSLNICWSQQFEIFPYNKSQSDFSWDQIELNLGRSDKLTLFEMIPLDHQIKQLKYLPLTDILDDMHVVDLNLDGLNDIIYHGHWGGEGYVTEFFLNEGNTLRSVFGIMQNIIAMEQKNDLISRIFIEDPGCCADYITKFKIVSVKHESGTLRFNQIFESEFLTNTEVPDKFFEPIKFEILNDYYYLRSSPKIDDSHFDELVEQYGNKVGQLRKGAKGRALASKKDETGRVWWFVEIDPDDSPVNSVFYDKEKKVRVGWISSRFVKHL